VLIRCGSYKDVLKMLLTFVIVDILQKTVKSTNIFVLKCPLAFVSGGVVSFGVTYFTESLSLT